jgi:hypothetical protein
MTVQYQVGEYIVWWDTAHGKWAVDKFERAVTLFRSQSKQDCVAWAKTH